MPDLPVFLRASALVLFASITPGIAQHPDTPIFSKGNQFSKAQIKEIHSQVKTIRKSHPILGKPEIDQQRSTPKPSPVHLPPVRTKTHDTGQMADLCRKGNLRVGYLYLCHKCDDWHLNTAGGYAIAGDVIVTCDHVLEKKTKMREASFIAIDASGNVAAVTAVMARNKTMDVAILRTAGAKFTPSPLNPDTAQGATAHCFSSPLGQQGYFSTGLVNRFYWNTGNHKEDIKDIESLLHLRADFSTDWAPGSSGSPLFDHAGNVIAHVSTITGLGSGKDKPALITLHTGIPARCVLHLVHAMNDEQEILRIASLGEEPSKEAN